MKQHITVEQLNDLSEKQLRNYLKWIDEKYYRSSGVWNENLISIGQMIEFLYQNETVVIESEDRESPHMGWIVNKKYRAVELCDALWQFVKEVLEKK